jgi:hypothetical protein
MALLTRDEYMLQMGMAANFGKYTQASSIVIQCFVITIFTIIL